VAGSTKHIIQSLVANAAIATAKGIAAAVTGSGALLAETIHSAADCSNQLLLLLGVKRAQRPADALHPLGYGRALYFWSFIVALFLFTGGGVFSLYEGFHKLSEPEPPTNLMVGVVVLLVSIVIEGAATFSNIRELNKRRGDVGFFTYLRQSKDSDLVVVFGENSAATLGLLFALAALAVTALTGDPRWDAIGTLLIGVVLVGVAVFLGVEIKSLLMGEAADPAVVAAAQELAKERPHFKKLLQIIAVQQGPGEVMLALKVRLSSDISSDDVCREINAFEAALRQRRPEVKWAFVEPDLSHEPDEAAAE
jgi:cation diffusion facilitator family transporter